MGRNYSRKVKSLGTVQIGRIPERRKRKRELDSQGCKVSVTNKKRGRSGRKKCLKRGQCDRRNHFANRPTKRKENNRSSPPRQPPRITRLIKLGWAKTKTEWMVVAAATRRRGRRRIYGRVLPQMVKRRVNRRTLGDSFERERTLDVIVYELWDPTGVE
ncbi:hypothetical protein GEV33_002605 [Tenebrio molitor]|uniref:Uncharacterized protein n=1 Tax=Tenebrio molitor TaxID=7067 RepID=A0A8J6HR81_TENMO|nr:hypothetical protein GEV33_002605 [Tenebrio molitor]